MRFRVTLSEEAGAALQSLSPHTKREVNLVIRRLAHGPDRRFDLPLQDQEGFWRARAGRRWRVIWRELGDQRIEVVRIRRRREAYQGMEHPGPPEVREEAAEYSAGAAVCGLGG